MKCVFCTKFYNALYWVFYYAPLCRVFANRVTFYNEVIPFWILSTTAFCIVIFFILYTVRIFFVAFRHSACVLAYFTHTFTSGYISFSKSSYLLPLLSQYKKSTIFLDKITSVWMTKKVSLCCN